MNKLLSDCIEDLGVNIFKLLNRKESNPNIFHNYCLLDAPVELDQKVKVFKKCETYNQPELVGTTIISDLNINTYKLLSKHRPILILEDLNKKNQINNNIYFDEISGKDSKCKERGCLIYLHGFSERSYDNEIKFLFKKLLKEVPGLKVLAVQLPYHMKRSPAGQPYSGNYIFDSCPLVTIDGFSQGVHDVSQVISYAKKHYKKVIVGGFSLGGLITSFLGTCDDRADLYIMGQAGASLPETLEHLHVCPGLTTKRKSWIKQGWNFQTLYTQLELIKYKPVIPPEKVVSIAGAYDKLITLERVNTLREFYKSKFNITYRSGHIGLLIEWKNVMNQIVIIINRVLEGV
ncbi:hypothetical protein GC105_15695 [Alkalibaculum sp. M08DMB]|uniref:Alpha/beta hydrolase n=1 Tax=Alkalibaculum sporogenes TaxID=2655001 RepID=A0A6A7KCY8_9FIRM|nr:hypothetical protein [Alkalibaculum sporogenes]MPW27212.1 hypothetical protein [Alkalibaculum sporogenes]